MKRPIRSASALVLVALLVGAMPRPASATPAGFAFLEIPAGARASALGGAYGALARGADAALWNPAGLASATALEITGGHAEMVAGLRHDHFVLAAPAFGGGLAASLRALYSEPIEERDELGNLVGTFGAHDLEFGLAWGGPIAGGVEAGASAQLVRERIANAAATTCAFGLGAAWSPTERSPLRLAASLQNWGADAHYSFDGVEGRAVPLPTAVQAGAAYTIGAGYGLEVRGALEGRFTRGRPGRALLGAEIAGPTGAAVRAGLRLNDDATGFSMGAGYAFSTLTLDYAWVPWRLDLGDTHRFTFGARF